MQCRVNVGIWVCLQFDMFLSFIITGEYSQALAIFKIQSGRRPVAACCHIGISRWRRSQPARAATPSPMPSTVDICKNRDTVGGWTSRIVFGFSDFWIYGVFAIFRIGYHNVPVLVWLWTIYRRLNRSRLTVYIFQLGYSFSDYPRAKLNTVLSDLFCGWSFVGIDKGISQD